MSDSLPVVLRYREAGRVWRNQRQADRSTLLVDRLAVSAVPEAVDQLEQLAARWLEAHPKHEAVLVEANIYVKQTSTREVRMRLQVFEEQRH